MIRKATATSAQRQAMDIQQDVASHMKHTLATSKRNYRLRDLDHVMQTFNAVKMAQMNYRAWLLYRDRPFDFIAEESLAFPRLELVQQIFASKQSKPSFRLSEKTYKEMKEVWEGAKIG